MSNSKRMTSTDVDPEVDAEKIREDLRVLLRDGESLLRAGSDQLAQKGRDLTGQLHNHIQAARKIVRDLERQTNREAVRWDEAIHGKPYAFIGLAGLAGILVGVILNHRR